LKIKSSTDFMKANAMIRLQLYALLLLFTAIIVPVDVRATTGRVVQDRLDRDIDNGAPVVVHVVVALCDNDNQGIVPVSRTLGNGQNPGTNLYWGAAYGVRTYLQRIAGWNRLETERHENGYVLDRIVLHSGMTRNGNPVDVYLVADAWDGAHIREAIQSYLRMAAGHDSEKITVVHGAGKTVLDAGGSAHLIVYSGHDGLMDFSLRKVQAATVNSGARSAIVLACDSASYFLEHLQATGAHPLLLTTGLMAPEAYTLDAAVRAWIEKGTTNAVIEAAAAAYHRYQKCGLRAARRLFRGEP